MERISRLVRTQVDHFQKNLESILEHTPMEPPKPQKAFEVSTDLRQLPAMLSILPENVTERVVAIFGRLAPLFDGGLLMYLHESNETHEHWMPGGAFRNGIYYEMEHQLFMKHLTLPNISTGDLRRTTPYPLLAPLEFTELCDNADSSAFVMKPEEGFLFLLFSKLPEPWLRSHMETVHKHIQSALADRL